MASGMKYQPSQCLPLLQSLWRQQRSESGNQPAVTAPRAMPAVATPRMLPPVTVPMPAVATPRMLPSIMAPPPVLALEAPPLSAFSASGQLSCSHQLARQQRRMTRDHDVAMFDKENDAMLLKQVTLCLEEDQNPCNSHDFF